MDHGGEHCGEALLAGPWVGDEAVAFPAGIVHE